MGVPEKVDVPIDPVKLAANNLANETDSDVYLFNSGIQRPYDQELIDDVAGVPKRRTNVILILVSEGGDADAAYRMARCLQDKYEKFVCIVPGYCKSAGTLLAIGANDLVLGDSGELGPLDVQMTKKDELGEWQSGLTVTSSIRGLHERSFSAFEDFFMNIKRRSFNRITFKTATDIAAKLTGALFAPIFQQIDPIHVGESLRATSIALHYGVRLDAVSDNLKTGEALDTLISKYPHHGFVIDRKEARRLFRRVRNLNETEAVLICALDDAAKVPQSDDDAQREFLSDPKEEEANATGEAGAELVPGKAVEPAPAPAGGHVQPLKKPITSIA